MNEWIVRCKVVVEAVSSQQKEDDDIEVGFIPEGGNK